MKRNSRICRAEFDENILDEANSVNEFKITPDVELKSLYEKAKYDAVKAIDSIGKLPKNQQRQLVEELIGAEAVERLWRIMCSRM